jgi:hypothetical protein
VWPSYSHEIYTFFVFCHCAFCPCAPVALVPSDVLPISILAPSLRELCVAPHHFPHGARAKVASKRCLTRHCSGRLFLAQQTTQYTGAQFCKLHCANGRAVYAIVVIPVTLNTCAPCVNPVTCVYMFVSVCARVCLCVPMCAHVCLSIALARNACLFLSLTVLLPCALLLLDDMGGARAIHSVVM